LWRKGATGRFAGRPPPLDEELAEMRRALGGDVSGQRIVDIGCSEGMYARHLALWGAAAIAVDHSVPFLAAARRRATRLGVRIAPVRALAQHLPIVDAGLDAAVTGGTLNEIGDIDAALAEAARVVKPGGTLFCMSLIRATTGPGRALQAALRPTGIVFPTLDDTTRRIEQAGWTITETHVDRIVVRTTATRRTHDASE
jgi:ubiquinone/menaquinone biosynthesis C-methylase UbiE